MRRLNQESETPFTIIKSLRCTGMIPIPIMQQIDPSGQRYYFQRDAGKICLTRYTPRPDPDTDAQRVCRQKFKDAWTAWKALSPEEQETWRHDPLAKRKNLRGVDAFFSKYLKGLI